MNSGVHLIVLTAGRPYVMETLPAWQDLLTTRYKTVVDDSGDPERREWLQAQDIEVVPVGEIKRGYNQAMQTVFDIARHTSAEYTFLLEDDFLPINVPDLSDVLKVMDERPYLAQMVYKRQPWWYNEIEAGGVLEALEGEFREASSNELYWVEHQAFWSCNPMVFRSSLALLGWPEGAWSESRFGQMLFQKTKMSVGMWGKWRCEPQVMHIGRERAGETY